VDSGIFYWGTLEEFPSVFILIPGYSTWEGSKFFEVLLTHSGIFYWGHM
jgi:hypothetical protein